jgi:hypothetical protein
MGAPRIPTEIGDVLILRTTESYTTHAVGLISERDQQDFSQHTTITHLSDFRAAVDHAKTLVATGGRIFVGTLILERGRRFRAEVVAR